MNREYQVITDIYNEQGKIVKKNILYNKVFETNEMHVESYIEKNGKVISKYTGVIYDDKYYKINKPFEEVSKEVRPIVIEGFKSKQGVEIKKRNKPTKITTKPIKNEEEEYEELPDHLKETEQEDEDSELQYIIEGKNKKHKTKETNKNINGRKGIRKPKGKQSGSRRR